MERDPGPTLLTYEEWWKWDAARVKAGKGPTQRRVVTWCTTCQVEASSSKCLHNFPHDWERMCDRVIITYDKKEPYEDGEGPVH